MYPLSIAHSAKRLLLSLVAVSLLMQGLFPSGYMPGNLASGWVAVLCPEGLPAAFVAQLNERNAGLDGHAHHHHHHHHKHHHGAGASGEPAAEGSCQLGSGLDQPVEVAQVKSNSPSIERVVTNRLLHLRRVSGPILLAPQSRGPPIA